MEDEDLKSAINVAWVLLCTALVFWEQAGFAMWEAGCLRSTSLHSILLKNMCDAAIGAAAFFTLGYAIGFGGGADHKFAGNDKFFLKACAARLHNPAPPPFALPAALGVAIDDYHIVFFQWAFAATAATTVSGCMAERTQFAGYLIYSFFVTAFIYAVPLHWLWADAGWLCAWGDNAAFGYGMIDFAGSGIVHMLGGAAGLVGSYVVGPRAGRFTDKGPVQIEGHSIALTTLGVYCLWFGWFGFNAGYTLGTTGGMWKTAALICVNTTISPSASILSVLLLEKFLAGYYDTSKCMNGIVAGLVGITGPCGVVEPYAAAIIGIVSGAVYCG
ncbi:putative ammonium transporter, partial [Emiliania huxleyi CCMP1516]|uniref:Ammonium transporter AmtB-like domain-containing protein n=2 Tax=Emiliania huxleyi TaxID=2903 RepID=A0A0D3KHJ3_EMIH1